jgi:hypothetical protein
MPLLNYTTKVPVNRSIREIQKSLVKAGASSITQDFDSDGDVSAVAFKIKLNEQEISFRLPSETKAVLAVMQQDGTPRSLLTHEHAQRVAWRIIKDWVEAQMAIVQTKMVTLPQVFLPYAVGKDGITLYQIVADNPNLLLGEPVQSVEHYKDNIDG